MIFCICASTLIFLSLYLRQLYTRFSKCGVKHYPPLPLVGNFGAVILRQKFFGEALSEIYNGFPERFVGNYELVSPVLFIKDIELIKKIAIQDSEFFSDHRVFISEESDPYFGKTLFMLRGQKWKDMRSTLGPAFTTSKLKQMIPLMMGVGDRIINSLKKKYGSFWKLFIYHKLEGLRYLTRTLFDKKTNRSTFYYEECDEARYLKTSRWNLQLAIYKEYFLDTDVKELSNHFANDVVASCALGLEVDSFSEPDNEFYRMGHKASDFNFMNLMKFFGYYSIPYIMKKLNITFLTTDTKDFFKQLVLNTMKEREANITQRPDMIQLLIEARQVWSDVDLIAQIILFVIAGYETISTTISFLLYELAINTDVQEKLVREIKEHDKITRGKCDYDSIQTMTYLDMVLSESLRLWPPAVASDRLCTKEYNLGRPNDKSTEDFIVRVGEDVLIPIMAIHRDANFFPDPLKFDPERFSDANKHKIQPFTYIPFGLGPRNCIGYRFALYGVKTLVYQLLKHMVVEPSERTRIPAKLCTESFTLKLKGGHWLRLTARNSSRRNS